MEYPTIFHLVAGIADNLGIKFVLIGGFAVGQYGYPRQTFDANFLTTRENFDKISKQLQNAGFELGDIRDNCARLKGPDHYLSMDIDFLFVDKNTLDKILADSKEVMISNQKLLVPSINMLIALKLHAIKNNPKLRERKDLLDIISIIRANKVDYKSNEFRELCLKYVTEDIYNKIANEV